MIPAGTWWMVLGHYMAILAGTSWYWVSPGRSNLKIHFFIELAILEFWCPKRTHNTKSTRLPLLLWCLWEGEFYQKGQTLGPARVGRHDKVWACNVLYQTWQPLWPSGQTSGFFPHPALLYRTNTSLHYTRHHLNLTGENYFNPTTFLMMLCMCVCVV